MTHDEDSAMERLASHAVTLAERQLIGEHLGHVRVHSCFYYGAVDVDPKHLVVWVILTGAPDEELPKWSTPEAAALSGNLDPSLVSWLGHLRQIVRDQFGVGQWPEAQNVQVLFDSEHRVRENGGWEYFK
jgi:hypothetical protein